MARKKGKGKATKKQTQGHDEPDEVKKAPHTFVLHRGHVGKNVDELMKDMRKVMEPYTASQLKVLRSNALKDFIAVAGPLNVTHMIIFTKSTIGCYMKVLRLPHGPSLSFRIMNYSLARDVISSVKRPLNYARQFQHHPLLVLNNFSGKHQHTKLMATMFQNMLPSININKVKLNNIRRCVLLNYNSDDGTIDFRHYAHKIVPTGVSRGVKKLVRSKIPNLSKCVDISDFITNGGNASESEAELDGQSNQVVLPQNVASRGNMVSQQSAIRLVEMGPRLNLQLIKIEEGILDGEVLYHNRIKKTPEEIKALQRAREKKKKLKEKRKQQQAVNVRRNAEQKEKLKKSLGENETKANESSEDDAEWFEKETGQRADHDLFPELKKKRKFEGKERFVSAKKVSPNEAKKVQSFSGKKRKFDGKEEKKNRTFSAKKRKVDKSFKSSRKGNAFKSKIRNVNRSKAKRK